MAERTYNPSSPACVQWEILLADSLDGFLQPADEAEFAAHLVVCPACSTLFDEARRGREWIEFLSLEPEVPAGLLDKILAQTGPGHEVGFGVTGGIISQVSKARPGPPIMLPVRQYPGFMGQARRFAEPRLLMTAAMAFFSIAMTLNLASAL